MVGVSDTTIKRDINKDATNIALEEKNTTGIEDVTNIDATYVAPPQSGPVNRIDDVQKRQMSEMNKDFTPSRKNDLNSCVLRRELRPVDIILFRKQQESKLLFRNLDEISTSITVEKQPKTCYIFVIVIK